MISLSIIFYMYKTKTLWELRYNTSLIYGKCHYIYIYTYINRYILYNTGYPTPPKNAKNVRIVPRER